MTHHARFMTALRWCVTFAALLLPRPAGSGPQKTAVSTVDQGALPPDAPVRHRLTASEIHEYRLQLSSGQALKIAAGQIGIDLKLELVDPGGAALIDVNDWPQVGGTEFLL